MEARAKTLKETEIDQGIDERIDVRDRFAVAQHRSFNPETDRLTIDALGGRTLVVNFFVDLALPVERIAQTSANTSGHGNRTAALARALMMNGTRLFDEFGLDVFGKERTDVFAAFVFDDGDCAVGVGEKKRHS